jgi:hypothetical protein
LQGVAGADKVLRGRLPPTFRERLQELIGEGLGVGLRSSRCAPSSLKLTGSPIWESLLGSGLGKRTPTNSTGKGKGEGKGTGEGLAAGAGEGAGRGKGAGEGIGAGAGAGAGAGKAVEAASAVRSLRSLQAQAAQVGRCLSG